MLEIHRTHRAKICNHSQVADSLDHHGWSASKLWNVATGTLPGFGGARGERKRARARNEDHRTKSEDRMRLGRASVGDRLRYRTLRGGRKNRVDSKIFTKTL